MKIKYFKIKILLNIASTDLHEREYSSKIINGSWSYIMQFEIR